MADASVERSDHVAATEQRLDASFDLDTLEPLQILELINRADGDAHTAVTESLPQISSLVDAAVSSLDSGGRIHYVGSGSSGRLALTDASELPPTFGVEPSMVQAHLAGGETAMTQAVEGAEDDGASGAAAMADVDDRDLVIGLSANGSPRFVIEALRTAKSKGATTAIVTSNRSSPLASEVDHLVVLDTGSEVVSGSTRMKGGTAQKMALTAFSTAVMVRRGRVVSNLMVGVTPTNHKLRNRAVRILTEVSGLAAETCRDTLRAAGDRVDVATVSLVGGTDTGTAAEILRTADGHVGRAIRVATSREEHG